MRVTQLDFRERSILERFRAGIAETLKSGDPARYACILMFLLLAVEATRLFMALGHLRELDGRRESIALQVRAFKARAAASHSLEASLDEALSLRRANARLAVDLAGIGNLLAVDVALTTLRNVEDERVSRIIEIDGRTKNITDVVTALRRLSVTGDLELHREESADGAISFRLGLNRNDQQTAR